jgi:hypothetical protein
MNATGLPSLQVGKPGESQGPRLKYVTWRAVLPVSLVLPEALDKLLERSRLVFLKAFLVHVNEVVLHFSLRAIDVFAPLPQSCHFERQVQLFPALSLSMVVSRRDSSVGNQRTAGSRAV